MHFMMIRLSLFPPLSRSHDSKLIRRSIAVTLIQTKAHRNLNEIITILMYENGFKNAVGKMAAVMY